jgi:hypothetical protein
MRYFAFRFDGVARRILPLFGIRPGTTGVVIDGDRLLVRFGPLRLATPLDNIRDADVTGPYSWIKAIGIHLSLADKGLTLGTNSAAGVCVRFHQPIAAVGRRLGLRHPGLTVTVDDPRGLAEALADVGPENSAAPDSLRSSTP